MNYQKLKINYESKNSLYKHYKELYELAVSELHFYNLQVEFLKGVLDEVLKLNDKSIDHKIIKQVIKNAKERHFLDKLIHNDFLT